MNSKKGRIKLLPCLQSIALLLVLSLLLTYGFPDVIAALHVSDSIRWVFIVSANSSQSNNDMSADVIPTQTGWIISVVFPSSMSPAGSSVHVTLPPRQ